MEKNGRKTERLGRHWGAAPSYGSGQAFETSQGRVHRAINEGTVDAVEYNVFIREQVNR